MSAAIAAKARLLSSSEARLQRGRFLSCLQARVCPHSCLSRYMLPGVHARTHARNRLPRTQRQAVTKPNVGLELRRELQQYPEESTPKINESLKDFFDRSVDYWTITVRFLPLTALVALVAPVPLLPTKMSSSCTWPPCLPPVLVAEALWHHPLSWKRPRMCIGA